MNDIDQQTISLLRLKHDKLHCSVGKYHFCCQIYETWNQIFLKCPMINYRVYPMNIVKTIKLLLRLEKPALEIPPPYCLLLKIKFSFLGSCHPYHRDSNFSSEKRTLFYCSFYRTLFMAH